MVKNNDDFLIAGETPDTQITIADSVKPDYMNILKYVGIGVVAAFLYKKLLKKRYSHGR